MNGEPSPKKMRLAEVPSAKFEDLYANAADDADLKNEPSTALVTSDRMLRHRGPVDHPECPSRLATIVERLSYNGLLKKCKYVAGRGDVSTELLEKVHSASHVDRVLNLDPADFDGTGDLFVSKGTSRAAKIAASCVVTAVKEVLSGKSRNAFALVRPPGHHATRDEAMGFCWFCNTAIGAQYALDFDHLYKESEEEAELHASIEQDPLILDLEETDPEAPVRVQRVLIFDWDIHHGNGVQDIFYDSKNVLYISMHRHDDGSFYPRTGGMEQVGSEEGAGYNINLPFESNEQGYGDADFYAVFTSIVLPIAQCFGPDLVIVSAGFDAAEGDTLGGWHVSPTCYAHITAMLKTLASGKLVMALEGGYDVEVIAECVDACLRVLLGEDPEPLDFSQFHCLSDGCSQTIRKAVSTFSPYWPILKTLHPGSAPRAPSTVSHAAGGLEPSGVSRLPPTCHRFLTNILSSKLHRMSRVAMRKVGLQKIDFQVELLNFVHSQLEKIALPLRRAAEWEDDESPPVKHADMTIPRVSADVIDENVVALQIHVPGEYCAKWAREWHVRQDDIPDQFWTLYLPAVFEVPSDEDST
eukprot:ANDGO_00905.mRNA.1 Histone deacetylase 18